MAPNLRKLIGLIRSTTEVNRVISKLYKTYGVDITNEVDEWLGSLDPDAIDAIVKNDENLMSKVLWCGPYEVSKMISEIRE